MIKSNMNDRKMTNIASAIAMMLLFASSVFLFYRQSIKYNGLYPSDLSYYIRTTTTELGDRLVSKIFYFLFAINHSTLEIAVYMGIVIILIVIAAYLVIKEYLEIAGVKANEIVIRTTAFLMVFTGNIYVPGLHHYFYRRSWNCWVWHSPTQQTMIMFSLFAMLFFLRMCRNYMTEIKVSDWLCMAAFVFLSVWSKPSFMLTIAPAVIVVFLIELAINSKDGLAFTRLKKLIVIGSGFIPGGILTLYFSFWYKSEETGNSIMFGLDNFMKNNPSILGLGMRIFLGLLIPLIVFVFNIHKLRDVKYNIALGMIIFGVLEWMFIYESGEHASHGNFDWGKQWACFYAFLTALSITIENYCDKHFLEERPTTRKLYFILLACALIMMVATRISYYVLLLNGSKYLI